MHDPEPGNEEEDMRPTGPTVAKWQLGHQLRLLRERNELTPKDVAELLGCSESKVYKVEKGENNIVPAELRELLTRYGVTDEDERAAMLELQREGKKRGWWSKLGAKLPAPYVTYIGFEDAAVLLRLFEASIVHGLLQTEAYARATIFRQPPEDVDRRVRVRLARQRRVLDTGEDALFMRAILDEAAIRRQVGGREVMREQLEHLLELAARPNIRIQILPFAKGSYPETPGPFTIMEFPDDVRSPVVYVESLAGDAYLESSNDLRRITSNFEDIQSSALDPPASQQLIAEALKGLA